MKFITNESTIEETSKSHNKNPKRWEHESLKNETGKGKKRKEKKSRCPLPNRKGVDAIRKHERNPVKKKRNKYHVQTRKIEEWPEKETQRKEKVKQTQMSKKESKALKHRKHINQHRKDAVAIK